MKRGHIIASLLVALWSCSDDGGQAVDGRPADGGIDGPVADGPAPEVTPIIDGVFDEWKGVAVLATDPAGDASGPFDVTELRAIGRGTKVYLCFDAGQTLNAAAGPAGQGSLLIDVAAGSRRLTVDLRQHAAYLDGDPTKALRWSEIDYNLAPTYADQRFEVRLDVARLGVKQGDTVTVDFAGSDALAAPASLTLGAPDPATATRSAERLSGTTFRVASLNVLVDGLTDPGRGPAIGRLLAAVAADVYCFQEVLNGTAAEIEAGLRSIDPLGDGGAWTAHRFSDAVVVTRGALTPLPGQAGQRFAGAALDLGGSKVVVYSLHLVSRGYAGSAEDQERIAEVKALVAAIKELRDGKLGASLDPWRQAPLIVVGDWNLVGSRTPLDLVEDKAGPALEHWMVSHLRGDDVFTWYDDVLGQFPPGMLDLLVHGAGLSRKNGFVLDSTELDSATLTQLKLQEKDSRTTDHLMIVADFAEQ